MKQDILPSKPLSEMERIKKMFPEANVQKKPGKNSAFTQTEIPLEAFVEALKHEVVEIPTQSIINLTPTTPPKADKDDPLPDVVRMKLKKYRLFNEIFQFRGSTMTGTNWERKESISSVEALEFGLVNELSAAISIPESEMMKEVTKATPQFDNKWVRLKYIASKMPQKPKAQVKKELPKANNKKYSDGVDWDTINNLSHNKECDRSINY